MNCRKLFQRHVSIIKYPSLAINICNTRAFGKSTICHSLSIRTDHKEHCFFRHNEKQTNTPVEGSFVSGEIPSWLEGKLLRNGPGIQKVGETQYSHMFDGLAILHNFIIKDGKAYYQSRALESEAYERNFAAKRIVVGEFGTQAFPDPCQSILGSLQTKFSKLMGKDKSDMEMSDNCCVNVGYYGDQLYAMTETVFLRRVDPESLKSIGDKTRIKKYCALNTATAHPHVLEDGTVLNVGNKFKDSNGAQYLFVSVPPASASDPDPAYKNAKIIAQIPSRWKYNPAYFHSFGLTKDKLIFVEQPYCFNLFGALSMPVTNYSYIDCLKWHKNEKSILHVINLEDGKPHSVRYETDNLFTFHHINAYEVDGCLVVDIAGYENAEFVINATIHGLKTARNCIAGATPRRYILPLNVEGAEPGKNLVESFKTSASATLRKGTTNVVDVVPHHFTKDFMELPRINYKYNGLKYNYFYGLEVTDPTPAVPYMNKITKIDIAKGTRISYIVPDGCMASEPIFVADPTKPNAEEDDGVILSTYLVQADPQTVYLLVLNAKDLKEISKVQFRAEGAVTGTFHGIWNFANKTNANA